jgi:autotransporter-associated beta strand protein
MWNSSPSVWRPIHRSVIRKIALSTALTLMVIASPAMAATHVWKTGASGNWSSAANWSSGGVPTSGESGGTIVQLPANSSTTMDISNLVVDEIEFLGSGSSVAGSTALGIDGANLQVNVDDLTGGNTISSPISITGFVPIEASVAAGQLTISGTISGSAGLVKVGGGTLALTGSTSNTYSGGTSILAGVVTLNQSVGVTLPGNVTIGSGIGPTGSATLRELQSADLASTANVTVNSDGVLDLNGHMDHINQLTIGGGSVTMGSGALTLGGSLSMTGGTISGATNSILRLGADVAATSAASGEAAINAPIMLDGPRTFTVSSGPQSPELTINGVVSDGSASSSLTKAGAGTLALIGPTANTYSGGTAVQAGVLTLNQTNGVTIPGALTIGTGSGAPGSATVREMQSSDLSTTSTVTVNSDGMLDLNGYVDQIASLDVAGGTVKLASSASQLYILANGALSMTGGSIAGPSGHLVLQTGVVNATSSPQGPATISANLDLAGTVAGTLDPTFTVTAGSPPELVLNGIVEERSGSHGLVKAGAGTLRSTANDTYTGTTTVSAGTFDADGEQNAPFSVASGATLTGTGVIGPLVVAGTLTPEVGLRVASLAFTAGGALNFDIPSTDPSSTPTITSAGPVTIDAAAVLKVVVAAGLKVASGTRFPVITNTGGTATTGIFTGGPFTTPDGVPLVPGYTGGTGNDMFLTAQNVAPVAKAITPSAMSVHVGQAVSFSISASDANRDALTRSWAFGDGTAGTGASTSHTYATPGTYTVVATVSDGTAQSHASVKITVTSAAGATSTTAFGARLRLTGPATCVRRGAHFAVSLTIASATGAPLTTRLTSVLFALGHQTIRVRHAQYRGRLMMPASAKRGASVKVRATASLRERTGRRRTAGLSLAFRSCR